MNKLMWWCAWSTYEEEFKDQLKTLGDIHEDAARELLHYLPQNWCRAYFDTTCKNQMVDNNFTESFNKWILKARTKPIIKMLEDIRLKDNGEGTSQKVQDVPLTAPQDSQNSEFVFMPTPRVSQCDGPSNIAQGKVFVAPSIIVDDEYECEDKNEDEDEEPDMMPKVISEAKTRLEQRKLHQEPIGTRKTGIKRDVDGVNMPTNLPYLPNKLT
nr:uncharacterized protein LOC117276169 isoform X1 [Nicotiana tomentosiformis]XP_033511382.1 uncharacterized protein LOC117276169 isoform X1 [Nicotiana tomentosiformis]XP_033511383.1 uncharacterized protein LOC117276169 isoform X1 [Nicotiana tomentosiformis]